MASSVDSAPTRSANQKTDDILEEEEAGGDSLSYDDLISTLHTEKASWATDSLCSYQGFWLMPNRSKIDLRAILYVQQHYKARSSDILLTSIPKSGTTWLKPIIFAIVNRNTYNIDQKSHPLLTTNAHHFVPILGVTELLRPPPVEGVITSPSLFSTHAPYSLLPESARASGCRIVHVYRDPKDVFVSMFHFASKVRSKELPPLSFEECLDLFLKGIFPYGPFWEHILEYYQASLEHPDKVLLVRYEKMQSDTIGQVKRLAVFLGQPFSVEEESNGVVQGIVELCSFERQRNLEVNRNGKSPIGTPNHTFYREGKVGESKNHLSAEMVERFDQISRAEFGDQFACLNM